jgi:hypothetical protein
MDDGTELAIRSGDAYELPPGHEVLVLGDERWESVEFASGHTFGLLPEELGERVLATVLFRDIVDSTRVLERLGDHAWASVLREHTRGSEPRSIASAVERWHPPATALWRSSMAPPRRVRAGALMNPAVEELGIRVRVGLHISEVEIVGCHAAPKGATSPPRGDPESARPEDMSWSIRFPVPLHE